MNSNIKLIIGPYKCGKTTRILTEYLDFKKKNPLTNALVIVPSKRSGRFLLERLKNLILAKQSESNLSGLFNLQILPFYDVCQLILKSQNISYELLPKELKNEVIHKALAKLNSNKQLKYLSSIAHLPGTSAAIAELIDEFERSGLTADDVIRSLEKTHSYQSRHFELANIYREYWNCLNSLGYIDQKQLAFLARECLFSPQLNPIHLGILLVDGFDRISPLQAQVIHGLAKSSSQTCISFDYVTSDEPLSDVFLKHEDYIWKKASFEQLSKTLSPEIEIMPEAKQLANAEIEYFSTIDNFLEMQEIARQCKQSITKRKINPNDILVVVRNLKEYRGTIENAFNQAQLDYIIDESTALSPLPLAKFLKNLLQLPINDFSRTDLIDCLSSPYFRPSALNLSPDDLTLLNKLSLEAHLLSGSGNWLSLPLPNHIKEGLKVLFADLSASNTSQNLYRHCQITENIMAKYMFLAERNKDNSTLLARMEEKILREFRKVFSTFLDEQNISGEIQFTREDFLTKLELRIEASTFANTLNAKNTILVSSADTAPDRVFSEIYIAGLVEGEFPKHVKTSGFIGSDELNNWQKLGISLDNPRLAPEFERALFSSLLRRSKEKICFSFPKYKMTGEELTPSFFIQEIFKKDPKEIPLLYPFEKANHLPTSASEAVAAWIWNYGYNVNLIPSYWQDHPTIGDYWQSISEPLRSSLTRLKSNQLNIFNGYLSDFVLTKALKINTPEVWSASSLNTYRQCPFKFWLSYILKVEPFDEPVLGLSPKLKGQVHHKILELYYGQTNKSDKNNKTTETNSTDEVLDNAFTDTMQWLSRVPEFHAGPYWENEKKEIYFRLSRFIQNESIRLENNMYQTKASMFEVGFGDNNSQYPALTINSAYGPIKIKGKIDRIDVCKDNKIAKVIDYKLGSQRLSVPDALKGDNLQIPIYALAVEQAIIPGSTVVEGTYISTNAAESIGYLDFEKYADLKPSTEEHIGLIISGVSSGDFRVSPSKTKVCSSCPHGNICRISELRANTFEEDDNAENN
jgi:ATP-dependent helicase/DNAse subunit B